MLRLTDGQLNDESFPGFDFVVETLSKLEDMQIIWKYADWSMKVDQVKAVKIFTHRPSDELTNPRNRAENILDYLKNYKKALIIYLEHLVSTKHSQVKKKFSILEFIYLKKLFYLEKNRKKRTILNW